MFQFIDDIAQGASHALTFGGTVPSWVGWWIVNGLILGGVGVAAWVVVRHYRRH